MKRIALVALLLCSVAACTSSNELGDCIGVTDTPKPNLVYKASVRNIFMAIFFSETIIVPIVVAVNQFSCPVARK